MKNTSAVLIFTDEMEKNEMRKNEREKSFLPFKFD